MDTISIKALIVALPILMLAAPSPAETISVWSAEDGYKSLDVDRKGKDKFSIYDYDRGTYLDAEVKNHGKQVEVYDYDKGEYKTYDLKKGLGGGMSAYDWETGNSYDINRSDAEKLMKKGHDCDSDSDTGFGGLHGAHKGGFGEPHGGFGDEHGDSWPSFGGHDSH